MANNNYIVAIDLGTSRFQGIIGWKNPDGTLHILAKETEDTQSCMRRGCIVHKDKASICIKKLIKKLENVVNKKTELGKKIRIEKVYVGVGGQSLHAVDLSVARIIPSTSVVTEKDIQLLDKQCHANINDMEEWVMAIMPPVYYLDGSVVDNPLGAACRQLKASYKLIVGWRLLRASTEKAVAEAGYELAGIVVSPLALADVLLSADEKEKGCVLINLRAGITSITIYKRGALLYFAVLPFGHSLITKDLSEGLNLNESEAEELKINYANVAANKKQTAAGGTIEYLIGGRKIDKHQADMIAAARAREIVVNVFNLVKTEIHSKPFGGHIKLAGGASELNGMDDLVADVFKLNIVHIHVPKEWSEVEKSDLVAVSLLTKGTVNCVTQLATASAIAPDEADVMPADTPDNHDRPDDEDQHDENGLWGSIFGGIIRKNGKEKIKSAPEKKPKIPKDPKRATSFKENVTRTLFDE